MSQEKETMVLFILRLNTNSQKCMANKIKKAMNIPAKNHNKAILVSQ
jgi:hypothetical protein